MPATAVDDNRRLIGQDPSMPDKIFAEPRLARLYDILDSDRSDLDHYIAMVEEFGAASVLDVGCGTGSLATILMANGVQVTGVDPAAASLAIAEKKPGADRAVWFHGDATTLPDTIAADLAVMTGNVAQVFLEDDDWLATLEAIRLRLVKGGRLVFETRDPSARGWEEWNRKRSFATYDLPDTGIFDTWVELTDVSLPLISFRRFYEFQRDNESLHSDSTLRFRSRGELDASLTACGFQVEEVRGAPDRPGKEWVFIAKPVAATTS